MVPTISAIDITSVASTSAQSQSGPSYMSQEFQQPASCHTIEMGDSALDSERIEHSNTRRNVVISLRSIQPFSSTVRIVGIKFASARQHPRGSIQLVFSTFLSSCDLFFRVRRVKQETSSTSSSASSRKAVLMNRE